MEYQGPPNNSGGWGNNQQQSNWGNNQQSNWGGNNNGWGNQPPNSNWGGNNNGWGNQGNQPSNWGGNNTGWGGNNQQSNWGGNNNGWGNQGNQPSNWGGNNNGWGNQGNQPPNSNWGGNNNGWGNQGNQQSNWGGNNMNNGPVTFIIKPIEGMLLKDLDTFSKMDPFCAIDIGGNKQRTKTCQGGGKNPKFHDTLTFTGTNSTVMNVAVFDEDLTSNDLAGQGTYNLTAALNNMGMSNNEYIDLHKNGKSAGRILISIMAKQGNQGW